MFEKICPGEEFLPKAPNPEDIVYDDGETVVEKESGFEPNASTVTAEECNIETAVHCAADVADSQHLSDADSTPAVTERNET